MSDDDAIPMDSGMAGTEGVATEGVAFKVKAEIQYSSHRIDEIRAHTSVNRIKDRSKIFQDKHDAQSPNVAQKRPTSSPQKAAEIAAKLAPNLGEKCPVCNKAVFQAERIVANGRSYHKTCLRCGLGNGLGCNKVLKTHDYEEYHKVMYCKACARKQHNNALAKKSGFQGARASVAVGGGGDGARASLSASKFPFFFVYPSFTVFLFQF